MGGAPARRDSCVDGINFDGIVIYICVLWFFFSSCCRVTGRKEASGPEKTPAMTESTTRIGRVLLAVAMLALLSEARHDPAAKSRVSDVQSLTSSKITPVSGKPFLVAIRLLVYSSIRTKRID